MYYLFYLCNCKIYSCSFLSYSFIFINYSNNFLLPPCNRTRKLWFDEGGADCLSFSVAESFMMFLFIFCWKLAKVVLVFSFFLTYSIYIIYFVLAIYGPFCYDLTSDLLCTFAKGFASIYYFFYGSFQFFLSYFFEPSFTELN